MLGWNSLIRIEQELQRLWQDTHIGAYVVYDIATWARSFLKLTVGHVLAYFGIIRLYIHYCIGSLHQASFQDKNEEAVDKCLVRTVLFIWLFSCLYSFPLFCLVCYLWFHCNGFSFGFLYSWRHRLLFMSEGFHF